MERIGERLNPLPHREDLEPQLRNPRRAKPGTGELAGDRGGRVGIIPQIGRPENRLAEVSRSGHGPDRSLEGIDTVAGAADGRRFLRLPASAGNPLHLRMERPLRPEAGVAHGLPGLAADQGRGHRREELTGIDRTRSGVGRSARLGCHLDDPVAVVRPADAHGRQPHQRAVGR